MVSTENTPSNRPPPLIQATGLHITLGGLKVLNDVDFSLWPGEIVTLVGLNGSGKSTLIKVLSGLLAPDAGRVKHRANLTIGYCPQSARRDDVLPMRVTNFLRLTAATVTEAAINQLLTEVGIADLAQRQLTSLSGGEYQRLLLARAVLRQPDVLLLDEPMAGVDVAGQSDLYQLIPRLRARYGCGVILVSHDIYLVMAATDRVVCLNHHICCSGRPESIAAHPQFIALFGQRAAATLALYQHHHDHSHNLHGDTFGAGHERGDHTACDHAAAE